jgi:O-antigen/teichoic acid export membrane protein
MSLRRKLIVGSIWSVLGVIVNRLAGLVVVAVLAHRIAPSEFGIVVACLLCVELSRPIMLAGLPEYLVKQRSWSEQVASTAFWVNLAMAGVLGALLAATSLFVLRYGNPQFGMVLLSLCMIFLLDALSATPEALMRHELRFRALAFRQVWANLLGGILAIISVLLGAGLWAIVIQRYTSAIAQAVIAYAATHWRPAMVFVPKEARLALSVSLNLAGVGLLGGLNLKIVDVIVGAVAGPAALGVYHIAGRGLTLVLQLTAAPAQKVALSGLSRLDKIDQISSAVMRMVRLSAFVSFPVFVGLSAVSQEFVMVAFGPQWIEAIVPTALLALIGGPATVTYLLTPVLTAAGRSKALLNFSIFSVSLSAIIAIATSPFGVSWVAGGALIRSVIGLAVAMFVLYVTIQLAPRRLLNRIAPPIWASAFMAVIIAAVRYLIPAHASSVLSLLILVAAGGFAYLIFLFVFCREAALEILSEFKVVTARPKMS